MRAALLTLSLWASAACAATEWPTERIGPRAIWDNAYDAVTQRRFIPVQLIVPGHWDGTQRLELPPATNLADAEGTNWSGPEDWRNPYSGGQMRVYDRRRSNRREGLVVQKMGLRDDGSAMGRAYDSRRGESVCEQEAKFPLGFWLQDEVRNFDYLCRTTRDGRVVEQARSVRITVEALDYEYEGTPHSLRFTWRYTDARSGEVLDHRRYIFVPSIGLAQEKQLP